MGFTKVALLLLISVLAANALTWKNCDSRAPAKIINVSISPTPIPLRKGTKITVSGTAEVNGDTGVNYKVAVTIKKKMGWFWFKLPCISQFGSCTYTGLNCQRLYAQANKPPQCPAPAGVHKLPSTTLTIPDVNLPSFVASGMYWVRATVYNAYNNRKLACVEAELRFT